MSSSSQRHSTKEKVRKHRAQLRSKGLRPIQIWVPDVQSPTFKAQAHLQSLAASRSVHAHNDQDFIDKVSERGNG